MAMCVAGDVATLLASDLTPLQKVKGAHMVFTTALAFSQDERSMLTVSADASALATQVSRTPTSNPLPLYIVAALLVLLFALVASFVLSRGRSPLPDAASAIQQGNAQQSSSHIFDEL